MIPFLLKTCLSAVLVASIATVARRLPALGALIASLPLVSVLGMLFLWVEKPDRELMATHSEATFWYVLPSLPMFLLIPFLLRRGWPFWGSLAAGCVLTILLYLVVVWCARRYGVAL
ncbi:peptide ABC transporter permease [Bombella intestini]|uniref:Peptide ABC transporter permease n=1 Tax=Bombella intestini TaxID=1539051 RepID=A0A1S8GNZ0_9PROT|nr:peptide ABC transporter permease [Bombella intestini]